MTLSNTGFQIMASRIENAIANIGLDLRGLRVLTEAASGPYIATAVLAAVAGSVHVKACARDSRWGSANDIKKMMLQLADHFGVSDRIEISTRPVFELADGADLVTNLGFVRPISRAVVQRLPAHAAISLMWEPWEFRAEDIDLAACRDHGIAVIATNEHHPYLSTFKAVGMVALKLLLERHCEVSGLQIVVVGSDPFGQACSEILRSVNANVILINPQGGWPTDTVVSAFEQADAVVLVEHRYKTELLGPLNAALVDTLARRCIPLVHICGSVNANYLSKCSVQKYPPDDVSYGYMTVTTAYVGSKPVVDLHAAGLHVASIVVRERQKGSSIDKALSKAVDSGYGLRLIDNI